MVWYAEVKFEALISSTTAEVPRKMSPDDQPQADYLGLGGRLADGPAPELVEAGFALEMADAAVLHDGFGLADIAHVVALAEAGCLPPIDGEALLGALHDMCSVPAAEFPYDPSFGDPWNSRERVLDGRAGTLAGWLWVGRPRREAARVALRIHLRRAVLDAHEAMTRLAGAYLDQARVHRASFMSDFTYLQPAQPTSLGYLLAGFAEPTLRHLDRLVAAHRYVNRSPAGAGGTTGTSVPIDRDRLAAALGFDGVIDHARDAMWQADGFVDLVSTLACATVEAGQVAADLEIWASPAFGFVELADGMSRVSALMPQKKNPYALAVVRQSAATVSGVAAGLLSALRTPTARTDHYLFIPGEVTRALLSATRAVHLLAGVVAGLKVDVGALARTASDPGLYLADLADDMVAAGLTDRRRAHQILGAAARGARAAGRPVQAADVLDAAGSAGVSVPPALLAGLGNPELLLGGRAVRGGWSRLGELLDDAEARLDAQRDWQRHTRDATATAETGLWATAAGAAERRAASGT